MQKLLLAIGILLVLSSCGNKPGQEILGKWESSGVFTAEFTPETASWPGGECEHSGYNSEIKQANGQQFEFISFSCKEPAGLTLGVALIDADTIIFANQNYFRIK